MRNKMISTDHIGLGRWLDRYSATKEVQDAHRAFADAVLVASPKKPGRDKVELLSIFTPGMAKEVPTDVGLRGYLWELSVNTFSGNVLTGASCFIEVDDQDRFVKMYHEGGFVGWVQDKEMGTLHH
jgi:hypothetical protein